MFIGLDFDNTIVCYDQVFHDVAVRRGLVPTELPPVKESIRDYLRAHGREDAWTELQGLVYGPFMELARPFDGFAEFLARCNAHGLPVCIVSHRTRYPFLGPRHDLHQAGYDWLQRQGFHSGPAGLPRDRVHFETTKQAKLDRIAALGCTHFVDDLVEFLAEPGFPAGVERVLFDPASKHGDVLPFRRARSWAELTDLLVTLEAGAR